MKSVFYLLFYSFPVHDDRTKYTELGIIRCEAIQSDRRVLRGCQGVEVISDSAQTQLRSLKADMEKKKSCIMRLLQGRDQLLKVHVRVVEDATNPSLASKW